MGSFYVYRNRGHNGIWNLKTTAFIDWVFSKEYRKTSYFSFLERLQYIKEAVSIILSYSLYNIREKIFWSPKEYIKAMKNIHDQI